MPYAQGGQVGQVGAAPDLTGATLSAEEMAEIVRRLAAGEQVDPNEYVKMPNLGGGLSPEMQESPGLNGEMQESPGAIQSDIVQNARSDTPALPAPPPEFLDWLEGGDVSTGIGEEIRDLHREGKATPDRLWALVQAYAKAPDPDGGADEVPPELLAMMGKGKASAPKVKSNGRPMPFSGEAADVVGDL